MGIFRNFFLFGLAQAPLLVGEVPFKRACCCRSYNTNDSIVAHHFTKKSANSLSWTNGHVRAEKGKNCAKFPFSASHLSTAWNSHFSMLHVHLCWSQRCRSRAFVAMDHTISMTLLLLITAKGKGKFQLISRTRLHLNKLGPEVLRLIFLCFLLVTFTNLLHQGLAGKLMSKGNSFLMVMIINQDISIT
jgi:hypothetical protein